jgi:hypothetical protein
VSAAKALEVAAVIIGASRRSGFTHMPCRHISQTPDKKLPRYVIRLFPIGLACGRKFTA